MASKGHDHKQDRQASQRLTHGHVICRHTLFLISSTHTIELHIDAFKEHQTWQLRHTVILHTELHYCMQISTIQWLPDLWKQIAPSVWRGLTV